jgi:hypothetical protein
MKNLSKKYEKELIQTKTISVYISIFHKICYEFLGGNLIGFETEYFSPFDKIFKHVFNHYSHGTSITNHKLNKKY